MDRIILWLAQNVLLPLTEGLKYMSKESEARTALKKVLDDQKVAIEKLKAFHQADDENDAAALQDLVVQGQAQNAELASLVGVSTTVDPSKPIDGVTGQNLPVDPVVEEEVDVEIEESVTVEETVEAGAESAGEDPTTLEGGAQQQ